LVLSPFLLVIPPPSSSAAATVTTSITAPQRHTTVCELAHVTFGGLREQNPQFYIK